MGAFLGLTPRWPANIDTRGAPKLISERRLCDAVDVLLSLQNTDGGFASYELIRAPQFMEYLNPAEVFGELDERIYAQYQWLTRVRDRQHHDRVQLPGMHDVRDHRALHLQEVLPSLPRKRYTVRLQTPKSSAYSHHLVSPFLYRRTITKAVDYLHKVQKPDGPWFGSWGIFFTYATQFALESLALVGETYEIGRAHV